MAMVQIEMTNDGLVAVRFNYKPELVEKIRTINGRKWHQTEKYWTIPETKATLAKLALLFDGEKIIVEPNQQERFDEFFKSLLGVCAGNNFN